MAICPHLIWLMTLYITRSKVKSNINKVGGCYGNVLHLNMITYSIMEPSEISFQKLECIGSKLKKDFDNLICNAG